MPVTNWNKALENISSFQDIIAMLKNLFGMVDAKADSSVIETIQSTVDSIKQGYKLFDTLALLNAYSGSDKDQFQALVNFDATAANNGVYLWKDNSWQKSLFDAFIRAQNYVNANPAFKTGVLTNQDLRTLLTTGNWLQTSPPANALDLNYPVAEPGNLSVVKNDSSTAVMQEYRALTTGKRYYSYFNGTAWSAWVDIESRIITNAGVFKVNKTAIPDNQHLDNMISDGIWFQPDSSKATLELGYPVFPGGAGKLTVAAFSSGLVFHDYEVRATKKVYRRIKDTTWSLWAEAGLDAGAVTRDKLNTLLLNQMPRNWEFFPVASAISVTYNPATKTLAWSGSMLAAGNDDNSLPNGRVIIPAGSVTFTGSGYEMAWLDLTAVPAGGVVTSVAASLKVGSYGTGSVSYKAGFHQIPMAKLGLDGIIRPAAGFLPIVTTGGSVATTAKDTFEVSKTATVCNFYLPLSNGNLMKYPLNYINVPFDGTTANSQSDLWRMETAIEVTSDKSTVRTVVTTGEWDNAIRVMGASDHVGGWHGDEVKTLAYFMIDGVKYADNATYTGQCKELIFIQKSNVYMLNSQTDILYKRTKVMRVNKDRIRNYQKFEFMRSEQLFTAWVSMLPILRKSNPDNTGNQITDTAIRFPDYTLEDVTSAGFSQIYTDVKEGDSIVISSAVSKVSAEIRFIKFVGMPKPVMHVSADTPYNKFYFSAIDSRVANYNVTAGAIWELETEFKLNVGN